MCVLTLVLAYYYARSSGFKRRERQRQLDQAFAAIETTKHMDFCACFVRASDFLSFGEVLSYEELRDAGKLVYRDSFDDLALGNDFTLFFSHQWTSFDEPDHTKQQYKVMCAAVLKVRVRPSRPSNTLCP